MCKRFVYDIETAVWEIQGVIADGFGSEDTQETYGILVEELWSLHVLNTIIVYISRYNIISCKTVKYVQCS